MVTADQTPRAFWTKEREALVARLRRKIDMANQHLGQSNFTREQKQVIRHEMRGYTKLLEQIEALTFRKDRDEEPSTPDTGPGPGPVFPGQHLYPGED